MASFRNAAAGGELQTSDQVEVYIPTVWQMKNNGHFFTNGAVGGQSAGNEKKPDGTRESIISHGT